MMLPAKASIGPADGRGRTSQWIHELRTASLRKHARAPGGLPQRAIVCFRWRKIEPGLSDGGGSSSKAEAPFPIWSGEDHCRTPEQHLENNTWHCLFCVRVYCLGRCEGMNEGYGGNWSCGSLVILVQTEESRVCVCI